MKNRLNPELFVGDENDCILSERSQSVDRYSRGNSKSMERKFKKETIYTTAQQSPKERLFTIGEQDSFRDLFNQAKNKKNYIKEVNEIEQLL